MAGTRLRARDYADSEDGHLFYRRYVTPMKMHSQMLSDSPEVARSRICEGGRGEGGGREIKRAIMARGCAGFLPAV